ncbi:MAG: DNA polymerase I [Gammaproteobacteria bacterium SG8_31]|jgi:DNA polymerase-1|nr:MAG: DNA polymerase I [Gammaproteobacteria bacterium SG8_31]
MSEKKPLILVDGSSYLYRAFHALPPLTTSTGKPTGAVLGVLNMLQKLIAEHDPDRIAVVFDAKGKTFRDEMFEEYKANRPPMPDDLRAQIEPLLDSIDAMGLPLLRVSGVEADDVIGTLASRAAGAGLPVLVSTGDKDMAQLVDDRITLVNTMTGSRLDPAGVVKKFGVRPDQIIDYLALVGDSSDNIPGVPKVGPKTAAKWLGQYDDIEGIKANAADIQGKVGESLRENLDRLDLSRQLATIVCDLELDVSTDDLSRRDPDVGRLRDLYTRLELTSLLRNLPQVGDEGAPGLSSEEADYELVLDDPALQRWLDRLENADIFAFDTETDSLNYMKARIVGVSMCVEPGKSAYVPLAHDYPGSPDQLDRDAVLGRLKPLLEDADRKKVGHHLKYDAHVLLNHGIRLSGIEHDTMLESYVLDSTATRHDMDSVAAKYLGIATTRYEDVAGKGARQLTFNQVPLEQAGPYAAEDADVTLRLHRELWPRLENTGRLAQVYREIEIPLVPILQSMERIGVLLDVDMLNRQSHELSQEMRRLEEEAHRAAGSPFNLGSPKQLQEILFERLGLPVQRKTPKGQPSTAEDVLGELAEHHELPRLILAHRELAKLKSTYTDKLPNQVDPRTGRVHTSYHQAVAATGRLSSSDPNLQNIPIRTPEGRRIRQAFIPESGHVLVAADYSQIELRIMAHLSGDEGLISAFSKDADIHSATAAEVFGTVLEEVTPEQRRSAKAINFGLIYGMSAFGLARQLNVDRAAAQEYVDLYFERYPGVKAYMEETRTKAREEGFVETVFGRRLYLPEIRARNPQRRQYAERSAINAPMQGTAADIIKRAMIAVDAWRAVQATGTRLIMQVHDELVFEIPENEVDDVIPEVVSHMSGAARLSVPLKVDVGRGVNWDEAH